MRIIRRTHGTWNLIEDGKLDDGVIYMATLNPKEPACWVMLASSPLTIGILNLAKAAYKDHRTWFAPRLEF